MEIYIKSLFIIHRKVGCRTMKDIDKKEALHKYYEILVCVLAFVTIIITLLDLTGIIDLGTMKVLYLIDTGIWFFFVADYIFRFAVSDKKVNFFKNSIFDLIAIIPFGSGLSLFRAFRIVRIAKLSKFAKLLKFVAFASKLKKFIYTNGFIYVLYANIITILLGAAGIYAVEYGSTVNSFPDALWWAFVTATTVGYGDISPSTSAGRLIAGILMIVGIGFVSMLTGTIATYFTNKFNKSTDEALTNSDISKIKELLEKLDEKD